MAFSLLIRADTLAEFDALVGRIASMLSPNVPTIQDILERIQAMSQSLEAQLIQDEQSTASALAAISTSVTALANQMAANVPTPGTTITQADADAAHANATAAQAVAAQIAQLVTPSTPPAPTPAPAA